MIVWFNTPISLQKITFSTPLTLILGQNGSGKTTIIECIKYALTGEMPPNCKNGIGFINNPHVLHTSESLGQVKLRVNLTSFFFVLFYFALHFSELKKKYQLRFVAKKFTRCRHNHFSSWKGVQEESKASVQIIRCNNNIKWKWTGNFNQQTTWWRHNGYGHCDGCVESNHQSCTILSSGGIQLATWHGCRSHENIRWNFWYHRV